MGLSATRIATILSVSWTSFPYFWETARTAIKAANLKKVENLRNLLPLLSDLIATLYMETEPEQRPWETAQGGAQKELMDPAPTG
jgi:hypothetical protein